VHASGVEGIEDFTVVLNGAVLATNGQAEVIPSTDHHSFYHSLPTVGEPGLFSQRILHICLGD